MATTTTTARPSPARRALGGPPLWIPAVSWAALTVAGAVLYSGTRPTFDAATNSAVLQAHPVSGAVSATLLLASAAPLAVWTASVHHRMQVLGVRVAGPTIGLVGGVLTSGLLALSGIVGWTAGEVTDPASAQAAVLLSFAAGGPAFAVAFALLVLGIAVPALVLRLLPRWLGIAGLVIAAFGVVALVSLAVPVLGPALPVVRFGGLLWLVTASVLLPVRRSSVGGGRDE
jgi:hypothetical protein